MVIIIMLALAGFTVSLYGFLVESKIKKDPTYKPACDLSDRISCSKPLRSKYSALFGISNLIVAMVHYAIVALVALLGYPYLVLLFTAIGALSALFFAYILYFKIQSFCLVCSATYIINIVLFIAALSYIV